MKQAKSSEPSKLLRREIIWINCFHWSNITTSGKSCLCYALAVLRFLLLQRKRKHTCKRAHKKKEKFDPCTCLRLCLCLRQGRFHCEINTVMLALACVASPNQALLLSCPTMKILHKEDWSCLQLSSLYFHN